MLNEIKISCFLSLCETLNFTETARRLYLTQQAVSKNINTLETDLGFLLFNRTAKAITLTKEGIAARDCFLRLKEIYQTDIYRIQNQFKSRHKLLIIGCQNFTDFGTGLVRVTESLQKRNPDLTIMIVRYSPGELQRKLYEDSVHLGLINNRYLPETNDYIIEPIFRTNIVLMVSHDHPLADSDATYLDFLEEPYIMDTFDGESDHAIQERAKKEMSLCKLNPPAVITVPNRETAYVTAEMNKGILLGTDISQGGFKLQRYRTDMTDSICCARKKTMVSPYVDQFIAAMKEAYSTDRSKYTY